MMILLLTAQSQRREAKEGKMNNEMCELLFYNGINPAHPALMGRLKGYAVILEILLKKRGVYVKMCEKELEFKGQQVCSTDKYGRLLDTAYAYADAMMVVIYQLKDELRLVGGYYLMTDVEGWNLKEGEIK